MARKTKAPRTALEIRIAFNGGYWDGRHFQEGGIRRPDWYNHAAGNGGHPFDPVYGAAFVAGVHDWSGTNSSDAAFAVWKEKGC